MILNRDRNATTAVSKPALLYAIGLVVMFVAVCSLISPVIAVPLGQRPAKQSKKESKAVAPAKSQEFPPLPPVPPLPPDVAPVAEPLDIPDIPDIPESPDAPLPPAAALAPDAGLAPLPGGGVIGGVGRGRGDWRNSWRRDCADRSVCQSRSDRPAFPACPGGVRHDHSSPSWRRARIAGRRPRLGSAGTG